MTSVKNDFAYCLNHLAEHLYQGRRYGELHALFDTEDWMLEQQHHEGAYTQYLSDIRWAWRAAENERSVGKQVRYGLIQVSINSIPAKLPHALLNLLVEEGIWSPDRAFNYVKTVPSPELRAYHLYNLGKATLQTNPAGSKLFFDESLKEAYGIGNGSICVDILCALTQYMPDTRRNAILTQALSAAQRISTEVEKVKSIGKVAEYADQEQREAILDSALEMSLNIVDEFSRADALLSLAPVLPPDLIERVLSTSRFRSRRLYVAVVGSLSRYLPTERRESAAEELLAFVSGVNTSDLLNQARGGPLRISAYGPEAIYNTREYLVEGMMPDLTRLVAVDVLSEYDELPRALIEKALEVARAMDDENSRVTSFVKLAISFPGDMIPTGAIEEALSLAERTNDKTHQAEALATLLPHVAEEKKDSLVGKILEALDHIPDPKARISISCSILDHLPQTHKIRNALLDSALGTALGLEKSDEQANELIKLIPYLPKDKKSTMIQQVVASLFKIADEANRRTTLKRLTALLPTTSIEEKLGIAPDSFMLETDADTSSEFVSMRLPNFEGRILPSEREVALARYRYKEAISVVLYSTTLSEDILQEMLDIAIRAASIAFMDEAIKANEFRMLAPHLSDSLRGTLLAGLGTIEDEACRSFAFSGLAAYLSEGHVEEALMLVSNMKNRSSRGNGIDSIMPQWKRLPKSIGYEIWRENWHKFTTRDRTHLLSDIEALSQLLLWFGGETAVVEAAKAVLDVGQWLP